ncbi:MAG: hypothetical protein COC03_04445 [Robiginitomaculum sp.]|nr:MAG: hypothetical protein COC03_04445 [Robiginitomaculum sp.]PHQ67084.1 MAG: hypothetical protein COB92_05650 [Robiginitomaculum sp.]
MQNIILHHPLRAIIIGNVVFPVLVALYFKIANLEVATRAAFAYSVIALIYFTNMIVICSLKSLCGRAYRTIVLVMALNILALIMLGDISFITAIPIVFSYL